MTAWSPGQYLKFEDELTRPARDLLAAVPLAEARRVVDIGCGPGNSTALLVERFPGAEIIGVDSSSEMLEAARERLPTITFVDADIETWMPEEPVDLLFASALFQWVPDHLAVMERLMDALTASGTLAVQMPDNFGEPSYVMMRKAAAAGPWAAKIGGAEARNPILSPAEYYDRLKPMSASVDIWRTIYHHPLVGPSAIVAWLQASGLRPYLARLDAAEETAYLAAYEALLARAYPRLSDGRVLLRSRRFFIVAARG